MTDPLPLLPCPFCGSTASITGGDGIYTVMVVCTVCEAIGPDIIAKHDRTKDQLHAAAAERWNQRPKVFAEFDVTNLRDIARVLKGELLAAHLFGLAPDICNSIADSIEAQLTPEQIQRIRAKEVLSDPRPTQQEQDEANRAGTFNVLENGTMGEWQSSPVSPWPNVTTETMHWRRGLTIFRLTLPRQPSVNVVAEQPLTSEVWENLVRFVATNPDCKTVRVTADGEIRPFIDEPTPKE